MEKYIIMCRLLDGTILAPNDKILREISACKEFDLQFFVDGLNEGHLRSKEGEYIVVERKAE